MSNEIISDVLDLHVVVFAGPNGSGKTTLIDAIRQTGLATVRGVYPLPAYFINPDQVAQDLQGTFPDQHARDEAAQSAAMRIRAEATASRLPFAFETVMSHPSRINEMLMLKKQDYRRVHPLQQRERELLQLIASLEKDGRQVGETDELHGMYNGAVQMTTTYYLAQLDNATNRAVIHDRLMLDTGRKGSDNAAPTYMSKENLTIHYSPAMAPQVDRHGLAPEPAPNAPGRR